MKFQLEEQRNPGEVLTVTRDGSSSRVSWSVVRAKHVLVFLKCFVCFYLLVVATQDANALKGISCVCDVDVGKDLCASFDWTQTNHATLFVDMQLHCHWSVHEDVWHLAK